MTKAPRVTGKKVIAALRRAGFENIRIKGSLITSYNTVMADARSSRFTEVRLLAPAC